MNPAAMAAMGREELERYARALGVKGPLPKGRKAAEAAIEAHRGRSASVSALGVELAVPMKRLADKRVSALLAEATDASTEAAMALILGEEQMDALAAAATDEDGCVDVIALATAFAGILYADELKN